MPLPKPKAGQSKEDWDSSCMSSDTMKSEYPDEKQRYAVCQSLWKEKKSMGRDIERRFFFADQVRAIESGNNEKMIEGYPAMFNRDSEDLGGFVERIAPGAFKNTLKKGSDVRALWNHDQNYVLGRTKSGTLKLEEDRSGLKMINRPPDTQWARDLMVSIGREDITQMSFGFWVIDEEWKQRKDKPPIRTLKEVELVDVSVVTFPAYPDTSVALRSMKQWQETNENTEIKLSESTQSREEDTKDKGAQSRPVMERIGKRLRKSEWT